MSAGSGGWPVRGSRRAGGREYGVRDRPAELVIQVICVGDGTVPGHGRRVVFPIARDLTGRTPGNYTDRRGTWTDSPAGRALVEGRCPVRDCSGHAQLSGHTVQRMLDAMAEATGGRPAKWRWDFRHGVWM